MLWANIWVFAKVGSLTVMGTNITGFDSSVRPRVENTDAIGFSSGVNQRVENSAGLGSSVEVKEAGPLTEKDLENVKEIIAEFKGKINVEV